MKKTNAHTILFLLLVLISIFPLWPKAVESILMMLLFITSVVIFITRKEKNISRKSIITVLLLSSIFIIYCVSSFYAENKKENLKFIIRTVPIFLFPLVLGFLSPLNFTEKKTELIKLVYTRSVFISLIITHLYLNFTIHKPVTNWEYRNAFEAFTDVHGTYFSLWIGFGVVILSNQIIARIKKKTKGIKIVLLTLIISYLVYWQIVLGARLPLFVTFLLITFLITSNLKKDLKKIVYILLVSLVLVVGFLKFDVLKEKTRVTLPKGNYELKHLEISNEDIRYGIYCCSFSLIKNSWLLGYGIGDVNDKLNDCYKEKIESNVYQKFNFNSHNQYVQVLLAGGVFSLIYFLINLFYVFAVSIKSKNIIFISLMIFLMFDFLTENILSRHDGVLFYSFFATLFFYQEQNKINK